MARPRKIKPEAGPSEMNALALRIWEGQSVSLALIERVERIKKGLAGQGWTDLSALVLPDPGFRKYL